MKSEEKSIQAISAQAHGEAADNRLFRKKLRAREKRVEELESMVSNLNRQLSEKIDQVNEINALKGMDDGDAPTTSVSTTWIQLSI